MREIVCKSMRVSLKGHVPPLFGLKARIMRAFFLPTPANRVYSFLISALSEFMPDMAELARPS